jgi:glycerophosphoryl diester phosphodiesterase
MIRLIAHRGASYGAPENTTRAFLRALVDEAADGIECDIQLLKDGTPIVFHDGDTRALCGAGGLVARMSLEDFRALRLRGEPLSTLDEVVAALASVGRPFLWNIELKPTSRPRELVAATLAALAPIAGTPDITILFSSFDPRTLMDLQARGWPHPIALLFEDPRSLFALTLLDPTRLDIHPRNDRVDAASAAAWHAAGHRIRVWTVDDAAEARRLESLGVDALITNRPGPLRAELATGSSP